MSGWGLGNLAKTLEAAIDNTLGIDGEEAETVLALSAKDEGSLLDTAIGKHQAEKLKQTLKESEHKLLNSGQKLADKMKLMPAADDFFADFAFFDKALPHQAQAGLAGSPAEKPDPGPVQRGQHQQEADSTGMEASQHFPDFDLDQPATSGGGELGREIGGAVLAALPPADEMRAVEPARADTWVADDDKTVTMAGASDVAMAGASEKTDTQKRETAREMEGGQAGDAGTETQATTPNSDQGEASAHWLRNIDTKSDIAVDGMGLLTPSHWPARSAPASSTSQPSTSAQASPRNDAVQGSEGEAEPEQDCLQDVAILGEPGPPAEVARDATVDRSEVVAGNACFGVDAVDQLKQHIVERDLLLAQKDDLLRVERERASGLEDILSKNKLVQEEHARHKAEKEEEIELLRAALEREAAKRAALTSEMCALRDSACNSSDLSLELAAAESAKAQLLDEGQKLMSDKQKLEATIKELRKAIKSKGEELKLLTEEKSELQKKADDFERELKAAAISYETSVSKIAQMRAMTQDTAAVNVELQKDKDSLQERLKTLEALLQQASEERDAAVRQCGHATEEAQAQARSQVSKDMKAKDKEAAEREEALTESLENLQTALRRLEAKAASDQERLREENSDLRKRANEAESRCQELSSSVADATRPLVRQIESLHANFADKARVWEQVEASLRQRCEMAEKESRAALLKQREALDQHESLKMDVEAAEQSNTGLNQQVSRLGAELKAAKAEASEAKAQLHQASSQLQAEQSAAASQRQEVLDLEAKARRTAIEHADELAKLREEMAAVRTGVNSLEQDKVRLEDEKAVLTARMQELVAAEHKMPGAMHYDKKPELVHAAKSLIVASSVNGADGSEEGGEWERTIAADLSDPSASVFSSGHLASHLRLAALEAERDKLADECAKMAAESRRLVQQETEVAAAHGKIEELSRQLSVALELLGAREEELDDLKETMMEQKHVFQNQIQALLASPKP